MSVPTHWFVASDPDVYEKFMARWSARLADPFLTFAGIQTGQRVLDVGCGTGTITLALAERGCSVVGIDASASYLEGARRRRSHAAITYELGDAQNLASRHWRLMWSRSQRSLPPRCDALPAQAELLHAAPLTSGAAFRLRNTSMKSVRRSTMI